MDPPVAPEPLKASTPQERLQTLLRTEQDALSVVRGLEQALAGAIPQDRTALYWELGRVLAPQSSCKLYDVCADMRRLHPVTLDRLTFREVFLASGVMEAVLGRELGSRDADTGLLDAVSDVVASCLCTDTEVTQHLVTTANDAMRCIGTTPGAMHSYDHPEGNADEAAGERVHRVLVDAVVQCFSMFKICAVNERDCANRRESLRAARRGLETPSSSSSQREVGTPGDCIEVSLRDAEATRLRLDLVRLQREFVEAVSQRRLQISGVRSSWEQLRQRIKAISTHVEGKTSSLRTERNALSGYSFAQRGQDAAAAFKLTAQTKLLDVERRKARLRRELDAICDEEHALKLEISQFEKAKSELALKEQCFEESLRQRCATLDAAERTCVVEKEKVENVYKFVKLSHNVAKEVVTHNTAKGDEAKLKTCYNFFEHADPHLKTCLAFVRSTKAQLEACDALQEGAVDYSLLTERHPHLQEAAEAAHNILKGVVGIELELKAYDRDLNTQQMKEVRNLAGEIVTTLTGLGEEKEALERLVPQIFRRRPSQLAEPERGTTPSPTFRNIEPGAGGPAASTAPV